MPLLTAGLSACGTSMNTRRMSLRARRKRALALSGVESVPVVMRSPTSTVRRVTTPGNGATIFWKSCSTVRFWTFARAAFTAAEAESKLARL